MTTPDSRVIAESRAERERLADLLAPLTPTQWSTSSLCSGWTAAEVLAHITMPFRVRPLAFAAGLVRARGNFDRYADRDARACAAATPAAGLVALLRANIDHPWSPPGGGRAGALGHDVIHGLDITEPLGLPGPPPDRIALVLAAAGERQRAYFGADLGGHRLVATDADAAIGDGPALELPAKEVLLIVTGRRQLAR